MLLDVRDVMYAMLKLVAPACTATAAQQAVWSFSHFHGMRLFDR